MPTAFSSLLFRDYSSIFLLLLTNPGMRSDVHVVLLGLLLIQRSWQAENFDKSPRNHDSRENPRVANGNHRIEETLTNRSGKVLNQKRSTSTYFSSSLFFLLLLFSSSAFHCSYHGNKHCRSWQRTSLSWWPFEAK